MEAMTTPPRQPVPRLLTCLVALAITMSGGSGLSAAEVSPRVPVEVAQVIDAYCVSCHGPDKQKGKVRLDQMSTLPADAFGKLIHRTHEALEFQGMPPEDAKQPTAAQRKVLTDWVLSQSDAIGHGQDADKLRYPQYGNYVDHDRLFDGSIKANAYTPARRWLVSPQIFQERVLDVFRLEGREREGNRRGFFGVTNPFVLPDHPGVRYYDLTALDGGHLLVMLGNAQWIAKKQIHAARIKSGQIKADAIENNSDRWYPKTTPAAFEAIILAKSTPTDAQINDAIRTQFDLVLRRQPSAAEVSKYLALARSSMDLAGNTDGLRQMMSTVLLESEFLYRIEMGAGEADSHGRRSLSPREAGDAIAYALGDRGPDAALLKAADAGRLRTKEDYRREVTRLLADNDYWRGPVDPALNGKHIQSHVTAHPKIIRFFREFFGYPNATKVFKDIPRSGGYYQNPDRGHLGTPGWLIQEADELVIWCVEKDRRVFENLLTTDHYFVYHNMSTDAGRKLIAQWKQIHDTLKDEDWRGKPEEVIGKHAKLLSAARIVEGKESEYWKQKRSFLSYMYYFEDTFGQGRTPFTRGPFTHGYSYHHSVAYNLPPLPERGRYEGVETPRYKAPKDAPPYWDYPVEQPFKVANRKGLLTHPAWLVAHSQNTATDPVRRGKWVREKLLAGHVPDVPITVDAQIPEDPHKTLRQRLDAVTSKQECWRCHQHMNPLGLPFEVFDDFGRHRKEESLEYPENIIAKARDKYGADQYKTLPVNPKGHLKGTGDSALDGDVTDALDLIDRLAKSQRARQSIIRHAFRFYMGRNEMLSDSQTLIDADRAYVESDGSFKAVIVSLLTSDSFMYRK